MAPFRCLLVLASALILPVSTAQAQQVQLRCEGTLLEARGNAELRRAADRLRFSLALEAEGSTADAALGLLQQRLAAVRSVLQRLQVQELEVSSPSTWNRPATRTQPAAVQASLQIGGRLLPSRLQSLIREVGALPGVRLAPVSTEAARGEDQNVRRQLLKAAYQDALRQAQDLAEAIGLQRVTPLEVQLEGGARPVMLRGAAEAAAPPFDPAELPPPTDRLGLQARFCAS
jgi:uncharacterized protein YggE